MATYELNYAEEHLGELFREAHTGEPVLIVRFDGKSCQLMPTAEIPEEEPTYELTAAEGFSPSLVPA